MKLQTAMAGRSPIKNRITNPLSFCLTALAIGRMAASAIEPRVLVLCTVGKSNVEPAGSESPLYFVVFRVKSISQCLLQILPPSLER